MNHFFFLGETVFYKYTKTQHFYFLSFFLILMLLLFLCLLWTLVSSEIVPTPHYRTPKNIAFSSQGGGSSHHIWVMEILKEMNHRGHNVSFFSRVK